MMPVNATKLQQQAYQSSAALPAPMGRGLARIPSSAPLGPAFLSSSRRRPGEVRRTWPIRVRTTGHLDAASHGRYNGPRFHGFFHAEEPGRSNGLDIEEQASSGQLRALPEGRAGRLGRRIGLAVYLTCLVYIVIVGFGTFVEGIFFDSARAATEVPGTCSEARRSLAEALRSRAAEHVAGDTAATSGFLRGFDDRIEALRVRCDDAETARLERTRFRVEITLRRFDRENGSSFERLGAAHTSPSNEELSR